MKAHRLPRWKPVLAVGTACRLGKCAILAQCYLNAMRCFEMRGELTDGFVQGVHV
jgi:hypothetical protein